MKNTKANFNAVIKENKELKQELESLVFDYKEYSNKLNKDLSYYVNEVSEVTEENIELHKRIAELEAVIMENHSNHLNIKIISRQLEHDLENRIFVNRKMKQLNSQIKELTMEYNDGNI